MADCSLMKLVAAIALIAPASLSCHEEQGTHARLNPERVPLQAEPKRIREPAVEGSFYPAGRHALRREIRGYLEEVPGAKIEGRIVGMISPHAGIRYSGKTAAFGYKLLEGKGFSRAVIIAPSHRAWFRGASIPDVDAYRTPLGLVPLDRKACAELLAHHLYSSRPEAHEGEHSLEVQLPFLQEVLGNFSLVPVVVGQVSDDENESLAEPIRKLLDKNTVLIASSDFTHYGDNFQYVPFKKNVRENIEKLDRGAIERIEELDAAGFLAYQKRTGATICGRNPIAVLIEALPRDARSRLLQYAASGDMTGDFSHSVSYASMVFTVPEGR